MSMEKCYEVVFINTKAQTNMKIAVETSHPYTFRSSIDLLEEELVVVDTQYGLAVGKVVREVPTVGVSKYVICKVDLTAHNERIEKAKQKALLKSRIDAMRQEIEEETWYIMMVEKNPKFCEVFMEYQKLK